MRLWCAVWALTSPDSLLLSRSRDAFLEEFCVVCKAWPSDLPPTDELGFPLNATNFEQMIKDWARSRCVDSLGVACGSFWVYDLDDLEDCVHCLAWSHAELLYGC